MIELTPALILENKAKRFAVERHGDQMYGDKPYKYHLEGVVRLVKLRNHDHPMLSTLVAAAWLHDVLEDTTTTYKELVDTFGVCITEVVRYLTKIKGESYREYMTKVLISALAREIKICDTFFNLMKSFESLNHKGIQKYPRQLDILVEGVYYERDI